MYKPSLFRFPLLQMQAIHINHHPLSFCSPHSARPPFAPTHEVQGTPGVSVPKRSPSLAGCLVRRARARGHAFGRSLRRSMRLPRRHHPSWARSWVPPAQARSRPQSAISSRAKKRFLCHGAGGRGECPTRGGAMRGLWRGVRHTPWVLDRCWRAYTTDLYVLTAAPASAWRTSHDRTYHHGAYG